MHSTTTTYNRINCIFNSVSLLSTVNDRILFFFKPKYFNFNFKLICFEHEFELYFSQILSASLFLTFVLLLTNTQQFIAFNQFASTGSYTAVYFYVAIILTIACMALLVTSALGIWATFDIFNKWTEQKMLIIFVVREFSI